MIQNLILGILFFENITSGIQCFYICPDVPVDITSVIFLISDFLSEVSTPTKTSKKDHTKYSFAQKTSLILRTSTHLTLAIICCRNTAKNLSDFTYFPADMFLFGVRNNICTAPLLYAKELHS